MRALTPDLLEVMIREAMARGDWEGVDTLGRQLDAMARPRLATSLLGAALWYAQQGLKVFALQPGSKVPYTGSRGFKDATGDSGEILSRWRQQPSSNIGIATGHLVDVIDVDGPVGLVSWARMRLPIVLGTVSTPRAGGAGSHLYIPATGRGNRTGMVEGVDYRGLGGYVVAPPSVSTDDDGRCYRWRRPLELAAAPGISSEPARPPSGTAGEVRLASEAAAEEGTCSACGGRMTVVEPGQLTHPCCWPMAVTP